MSLPQHAKKAGSRQEVPKGTKRTVFKSMAKIPKQELPYTWASNLQGKNKKMDQSPSWCNR